jgi:hypothetical protein
MRLTALFYSILPVEINSIYQYHALLAEVKKLFQAFLLHHIGHPSGRYLCPFKSIRSLALQLPNRYHLMNCGIQLGMDAAF